jgi:fumarate hydratase class I
MQDLTEALVELFRRAATDLPTDVEQVLREAHNQEEEGSAAQSVLASILENVTLAREQSTPICQDTGTPIFYVHYPLGWSTIALRKQIRAAAAEATQRSYLRPNAVDSLTGWNSGDNTGLEFPVIHFIEWEEDYLQVDVTLKGGGCENVGIQYKLPDSGFKAGRDLEGVRKVVLDAVVKAQGQGCAPGILGVAIGGDRGTGYELSKEQFLRPIGTRSENPDLAGLEERLLDESNALGIGPMGFGGKTTVLDVQIDAAHRLPASYFVTVSYMCWACRRRRMTVRGEEVTYQ